MLSLCKPSSTDIAAFRAAQDRLDFTYAAVGATARTAPVSYVVDRFRVKLGDGEETFAAARQALEQWEHFHLGWIEALKPQAAIRSGEVATIAIRIFGLW